MAAIPETATASHRRTRMLALLCVLVWTVAVLVAFYWPSGFFLRRLELRSLDWRFHQRGPLQPSPQIVIVGIDEESIRALGQWPWPRSLYADLAERLYRAGASRVVFDVFFTDPDTSVGGKASDARLAAATRQTGFIYHSGFAYTPREQPPDLDPRLAGLAWQQTRLTTSGGLAAVAGLFEAEALALPLRELALGARGVGIANLPDPEDDTYRHLIPLMRYRGATYPAVALALAADLLAVKPEAVEVRLGQGIRLGDQRLVPLDADGRLLINFMGGDHTYPYVGASDVLQGKAAPAALRDKVVLVGWTAPGINDLRASPYATVFNGVETEANALDNILTGRFLRQVHPAVTGLAMLLSGVLLGLLLPRLPSVALCLLGGGGAVAWPWVGAWLFSSHGLVVHVVSPVLLIVGAFVIVLVLRLALEERQRHQAHGVLARFVPPQLVGRLMEEEALSTISGERRPITVFFADLRNFTATADEMAPEDTVTFLNRYFALMHEIIWEHEGTLDKYIGDEIMAFYNAPLTQEDHARRAVMTAIDMQRRIQANSAEWEWLQVPHLQAGIGIATGQAVVGYVGSAERMQYTVIGSTVNLASRLQAQCKHLGCRLLISDETYRQVADLVAVEDMGEVPIPGLAVPVRVWHVLDYLDPQLRGNWEPVDRPVRGAAPESRVSPRLPT